MRTFVYQGLPSRVVFGDGALQHLGEEIEKLGAERALLLSTRTSASLPSGWPGYSARVAQGSIPRR